MKKVLIPILATAIALPVLAADNDKATAKKATGTYLGVAMDHSELKHLTLKRGALHAKHQHGLELSIRVRINAQCHLVQQFVGRHPEIHPESPFHQCLTRQDFVEIWISHQLFVLRRSQKSFQAI